MGGTNKTHCPMACVWSAEIIAGLFDRPTAAGSAFSSHFE
jgi:hypothetical protein